MGTARAVAEVHGWFQPDKLVPWQVVLTEHSKLGLPLASHYPLIAGALYRDRRDLARLYGPPPMGGG